MKPVIYLSLFLFVCIGCKNGTNYNKTIEINASADTVVQLQNIAEIKTSERPPYFKASGNEPFWGLEIFDNLIVFKTIGDSIKMPHVKPVFAMDSNVKLYKLVTESAELNIQISQQECINSMSGNSSPYKVSINYRKTIDPDFKNVEGCGHYISDYRLHDIWVLEELNGKKITKEDFSKEFPSVEINATTNKFFGFAGCNRMNGTLFFEKDRLRFTNIVTTKMMCQPNNKEPEFLKAMEKTTSYSIKNNRLVLSNPSGEKTIFKKID
ncbi:META domain-containing protein [Gaetbulibacter sp. M235]|uniref:META domain-containing protein n=1 Tax=Gaetbulibacter sp. M235 TaxID=3126510 RepID=UPI00374FAD67